MAPVEFNGSEWISEELKRLNGPEYRSCAVIVDARQADHPILFATAEFMRITGYDRDFVTGRNCRFLQGNETCADTVTRIRHALDNAASIDIDILNYAKDGRRLNNHMQVRPFFDRTGGLRLFGGYLTFTTVE